MAWPRLKFKVFTLYYSMLRNDCATFDLTRNFTRHFYHQCASWSWTWTSEWVLFAGRTLGDQNKSRGRNFRPTEGTLNNFTTEMYKPLPLLRIQLPAELFYTFSVLDCFDVLAFFVIFWLVQVRKSVETLIFSTFWQDSFV